MRRKNWQRLVEQEKSIREDDGPILDAIDDARWEEYEELVQIQNQKVNALYRILLEVLEDEKDNLN